MKTTTHKHPSRSPFLALRKIAVAGLLGPLALFAQAQVVTITSDTTVILNRSGIATGEHVQYSVASGATLTFTATTTTNGGGAYNLGAGGILTVGGSGRTVFEKFTGTLANGTAVHGGVLTLAASSTANLTNVTFQNNSASGNGGGIRNQGAVIITNGTFYNNFANNSGGAIQNTAATASVTLTNVAFMNNRVGLNGGALANATNGAMTLVDVLFQNNWAAGNGGALLGNGNVATTLRLTGSNGVTDYHYTGNFAGGGAMAVTAEALQSGVANFDASAAAGGFYYHAVAATITFDIASGVSLTVGGENATNRAHDSIASSATTASMAKTGGGSMVLNANNSYYSGTFAINVGKVLLGNTEASLGGIINIGDGATFGGSGTVATSGGYTTQVNASAGSIIQIGIDNAGASTLAVNELMSFADGATLSVDLFGKNTSDLLSVANGTLNWAGSGTIDVGALSTGVFTLAEWGAGDLTSAASLSLISDGAQLDAARGSGVLSVDSQKLILTTTIFSLSGTWTGGVAGTWVAGGSGWDTATADTHFQNGDNVSFISGGSLDVSGRVIASGMNVSGAGDLIFAGSGGMTLDGASVQPNSPGVTDTSGALIKSGAGTLTFVNTGTNTLKGGVQLNGGGIAFAGADQFALAGASVTITNTGTLTALAGASGTIRGDLVLASAATDATFAVADGGAITLDGALRGGGGAFAKTGGGALALLGNSSAFAGTTRVGAGSLLLAQGASLGGAVTIADGARAGGAGALAGTVAVDGGGTLQTGLGTADSLTLSVGNLQLASGAMLDFFLLSGDANPGNSVNSFLDVGTLGFVGAGVTGGNITINISDLLEGVFDLASFSSYDAAALQDFSGAHIRLNSRELTSRENAILSVESGTLSLSISKGNQRVFWTGINGSGWAADLNWRNAANSALPFADGDVIVFDGSDTAGNRDIVVEGTQMKASGMEVVGSGDYRFTGGAIVLDADSASGIAGTGELLVNTTGTLTLANTGTNDFKQGIRLAAGTIVAETDAGIGLNTINVAGRGTLQLGATGTSTKIYSNQINIENSGVLTIDTPRLTVAIDGSIESTGSGSLVKTGEGALSVRVGSINVHTLDITNGLLLINSSSSVTARDALYVHENGSISNIGGTVTTPVLVNQGVIRIGKGMTNSNNLGTMTVAGNYMGDGGMVVISASSATVTSGTTTVPALRTDRLVITGTLQGSLYVTFSQEPAAFGLNTDWSWEPIVAGAIDPDASIDPRSDMLRDSTSSYNHALTINPDGTITFNKVITPELPPLIAVDAASILIGKASLESVANRLGVMRMDTNTNGRFNVWVSGLYRHDKLGAGVYNGAKSETHGAQVGIDWGAGSGDRRIYGGAFYDYAKNDMNCRQSVGKSSADTEANGFGIYGGIKRGQFHMDVIARMASEDYDITTPGSETYDTSGDSWAASLGAGYVITGKASWDIEPQVRLTYQSHKIDDVTDTAGRAYDIDSAESFEAYAGLRVSQRFELGNGASITPFARGGVTWEMMGRTEVRVAGEAFENDLGDVGSVLEGGLLMQLNKGVYATASGAWYKTRKVESFGFDLTLGVRW